MHQHRAPRASAGEHPERRPRLAGWRFVLLVVFVAALVTGLVRSFLVDVYYIPSESMQPLLTNGDRVLVDKRVGRGDISRGDVIVFDGRGSFDPITDPRGVPERLLAGAGQWLGLTGSDTVYVKRVIGVAGDRVVCCSDDGRLEVNGQPLDEPYVYPGDAPSDLTFDVAVPDGRLWVLGDHRSDSVDSRALLGAAGGGLVAEDRVIGRAFQLVWPVDRFGPTDDSHD